MQRREIGGMMAVVVDRVQFSVHRGRESNTSSTRSPDEHHAFLIWDRSHKIWGDVPAGSTWSYLTRFRSARFSLRLTLADSPLSGYTTPTQFKSPMPSWASLSRSQFTQELYSNHRCLPRPMSPIAIMQRSDFNTNSRITFGPSLQNGTQLAVARKDR